jgi:molybdopterin molybdotransferase
VETSLSARDAALAILRRVTAGPPLRVPLAQALGSVLAEPIVSPIDVPFRTNSAMDGYAVRAADVRGATAVAPKRLVVVDRVAAGAVPTRPIGPGEAARIFTGAPLPEGADSVVRQEDTDHGSEIVTIEKDRDAGVNFRLAGEDIRRGALVLEPGVELRPAALGVLASLAVTHPLVHRRPRVAILASGDEIVDLDQPDEILAGRKIATSNSYTLGALVTESGGLPIHLGIAADTKESVIAHLERALDCDLIVTSAGISVGEHDQLRPAIEAMGGTVGFWRLRMRPGAPVGFGELHGIPWIGLPGNPVSTMVTFELFVRPAIRAQVGHRAPFRRSRPVRVVEPIRLGPKLQHFLRAVVTESATGLDARLTGPQGSGILTSMLRANALLIVPEGQFETPAGAAAEAMLLDDSHSAESPPY